MAFRRTVHLRELLSAFDPFSDIIAILANTSFEPYLLPGAKLQ